MKKAELEKLVIGSIVRHRGNNKEYKVVEITKEMGSLKVSEILEGKEAEVPSEQEIKEKDMQEIVAGILL